jgi:DNA-binding MarR family transcriptional regulator
MSTGNEPLLGALLRAPYDALRARVFARLRDEGYGDVQPAHHEVLRHPGPEGLRPSELAHRRGVTKQAMNELLQHLIARGYIETHVDPSDRRAR